MARSITPDEIRAFVCPKCGDTAKSKVHGRVIAYDPEAGPPAEFALVQCSNEECQSPLVQVREDYGRGFEEDKPTFYYPAPRRLSNAIPRRLREAFDEARRCYEAKAYRATVAMVRGTLEGTCADQGSTKATLAQSLQELQMQGKIDGILAQWADLLRIVGNEGAHFSERSVTAEDAKDALDFAEALLDHLYVLRERFEIFKARQDKRQARRTAKKATRPKKT